jgi:hypothetical protein
LTFSEASKGKSIEQYHFLELKVEPIDKYDIHLEIDIDYNQ